MAKHGVSGKGMECKNNACDECKQNCLLIHGRRDPSRIVTSFFKVMIDESFLKILFFPPRFARSVSHLTDQETYLEDSSGQRWRVKIRKHNGSLVIHRGWREFSSEHGLKVGDFLVFHYVQGQHFIVQIFDRSACQKIDFHSDIGSGKKRARTYSGETSQVELLQTIDINSVHKKSKTLAVTEYEKVTHQSNMTNFTANIEAETRKGQLVHAAIYVDESFCTIDRDTQYDQEGDRLCLDLSSFEMPTSKPSAGAISSLLKAEDILLSRQRDDDDHSTGIISCSFLKPAEYSSKSENVSNVTKYQNPQMGTSDTSSHMVVQFENERGPCTGSDQITGEKCKEASQFNSGKEPTDFNVKAVKCEPDDSGDTPFLNTVSYSCVLKLDCQNFLQLPEMFRKHLSKRGKLGRWIIYLQGTDKRRWPSIFNSRSGFHVLTSGWKKFTTAYGLKPGDECLLELKNLLDYSICEVRKIEK